MSAETPLTFGKKERLCSRKLIDRLFVGNTHTNMTVWPLRAVFHLIDKPQNNDAPEQVLISVSKRFFKRANKRNRVKRQIREAFRKNKGILYDQLLTKHPDKQLLLAFIWMDDKLHASDEMETKVGKILHRVGEKL